MTRRLLVSYISITLFVLVVLEVPLGFAFARSERRQLEADVVHDAFALAMRSEESLETAPPDLQSTLQDLADRYEHSTGGRVVFVDSSGTLLADSDPPELGTQGTSERSFASRPEFVRALRGREAVGSRHSNTLGVDLLYVAVPIGSGSQILGAVRITYPLSFVDDRVRDNWLILAGVGGVVLAVVLVVSVVLARGLTRPLDQLERGASDLGRGLLSTRVAVPRGPHELHNLARSFNATAVQLEQLVESQRAFVADASHQLRTPLAALRLRLENLDADVAAGGRDDLEGALDEVERLSHLVDSLLALARATEEPARPEPIALGPLVEGRREAWSALAEERGVGIEARVGGERVLVTAGRVEQVLDNLLNNALEVAPAGSAVRIESTRDGDRVVLRVADAGPGMTEEARARAFDRFWRSEDSRGDGSGFGLGLAIVRQLVTADGGDVTLGAGPEGGLEVEIRLPSDQPVTASRGG